MLGINKAGGFFGELLGVVLVHANSQNGKLIDAEFLIVFRFSKPYVSFDLLVKEFCVVGIALRFQEKRPSLVTLRKLKERIRLNSILADILLPLLPKTKTLSKFNMNVVDKLLVKQGEVFAI